MNASVEVKMLAGLLEYVARALAERGRLGDVAPVAQYVARALAEHMEAERATELAETLDAIADELRQTA